MKKTFWIWELVVLILILAGAWLASGDLAIYGEGVIAAFILVLPLLLLFMSYSPREIGRHFMVVRNQEDVTMQELQVSLDFFKHYNIIMILATILPIFIGAVALLRLGFGPENGPDLAMIGPSLVLMLLSVVYGLSFITLITLPRIGALKKKLAEKE